MITGPTGRHGERREEILARVQAEQAALDAEPQYGLRSLRRVRSYLPWIWPVGLAIGLLVMRLAGWSWLEGIGLGVSLGFGLFYIGYVLLTERDDGRIQRGLQQRLRARAGEGSRDRAA